MRCCFAEWAAAAVVTLWLKSQTLVGYFKEIRRLRYSKLACSSFEAESGKWVKRDVVDAFTSFNPTLLG